MNEHDTLHLWFKPMNTTVFSSTDMSFVERYCQRYYPKAMERLAGHLHRSIGRLVKLCPGMFQYQLMHHTKANTNRYFIEESLKEIADINGLQIAVQSTTAEERVVLMNYFDNPEPDNSQTVRSVVAYLKDSIEQEPERWSNIRTQCGKDALPMLMEVIGFLDCVKNIARIQTFSLEQQPDGMQLTIALVTPRVLAYYTRIDWKIT